MLLELVLAPGASKEAALVSSRLNVNLEKHQQVWLL